MSKNDDEAFSVLASARNKYIMAFDEPPFPDIIRWALDTCIKNEWRRSIPVILKAVQVKAQEQGLELPAGESGLIGYLSRREPERWANVKVK